jgi:hypothetical protein
MYLSLQRREAQRLSPLRNYVGVYYGRQSAGFMAGMGYILSYDLVDWIAKDPFPKLNQIGQEDGTLAFWLVQSQLIQHWLSDTEKAFYDFPSSGRGWAHPYSKNTILIHQLKQDDRYVQVAHHFLGPVQEELNAEAFAILARSPQKYQ